MTNPSVTTPDKTILSVGQLNRKAKQLLETHLSLIWVSGELSNLVQHGSGHWYFTLKDAKAQIKCAMFKPRNRYVQWQPKNGQQLVVRARVSLYEARGDYQLIVEHMELAGHGNLQQAYEALKQQLQQEGLFDESRKQTLPEMPQHIGIITSPTGAAVNDILTVLKRRYPIATVTVIPALVQGDDAPASLINGLLKAEQLSSNTQAHVTHSPLDVLIIGRGGGSIEDLWAFNNEQLARAIADCSLPIISAVGHEIDFTIADFVADVRAPTPSASAEIAVPDISEWQQTFDNYHNYFTLQIKKAIAASNARLLHLFKRLRHPGERIRAQQQQLHYRVQSLIQLMNTRLNHASHQLSQQQWRLEQQHPQATISLLQQRVQHHQQRLIDTIGQLLAAKQNTIANSALLLDAVSPLHTLKRGYSIVSDQQQTPVRNSRALAPGDQLTARFSAGSAQCEVIALTHEDE